MSSAVCRPAARFVLLIFLSSMALYGQQLATLNIRVADPSGSAIPEARITLRNMATGAKRTVLSSGAGIAVVPALSAGSYQLTVESDAFAFYQGALTLAVGQIAILARGSENQDRTRDCGGPRNAPGCRHAEAGNEPGHRDERDFRPAHRGPRFYRFRAARRRPPTSAAIPPWGRNPPFRKRFWN